MEASFKIIKHLVIHTPNGKIREVDMKDILRVEHHTQKTIGEAVRIVTKCGNICSRDSMDSILEAMRRANDEG